MQEVTFRPRFRIILISRPAVRGRRPKRACGIVSLPLYSQQAFSPLEYPSCVPGLTACGIVLLPLYSQQALSPPGDALLASPVFVPILPFIFLKSQS